MPFPLYQFSRRRSEAQIRGSFKPHAERERIIRSYTGQGRPVPLYELEKWHGTAVRDTFGYGKIPLAGYIKKRAAGRLDLLLIDEVHQYKGIDSDQGYAAHHLSQAAQKVVALTGTIYGGKASSLFYLLFRLAPEMRRAYVDPEAAGQRRLRSRRWVSAYGILQRVETVTLDEACPERGRRDGKQTANSRSNVRYKELPGGSPAMLPWLLNRSVFLSLGDMGFPLPDYDEIPVAVPMAPAEQQACPEQGRRVFPGLRLALDVFKARLIRPPAVVPRARKRWLVWIAETYPGSFLVRLPGGAVLPAPYHHIAWQRVPLETAVTTIEDVRAEQKRLQEHAAKRRPGQAITTPGTRLSWDSLAGWIEAWQQLQARAHSSDRYIKEGRHLRSLPLEMIAVEGDETILYDFLSLMQAGDARPPKGCEKTILLLRWSWPPTTGWPKSRHPHIAIIAGSARWHRNRCRGWPALAAMVRAAAELVEAG